LQDDIEAAANEGTYSEAQQLRGVLMPGVKIVRNAAKGIDQVQKTPDRLNKLSQIWHSGQTTKPEVVADKNETRKAIENESLAAIAGPYFESRDQSIREDV